MEIGVESFFERIKYWLIEERNLSKKEVRSVVMAIEAQLCRMVLPLKNIDSKYIEAEMQNFALEIEDVAYDFEDILATFFFNVAFKRADQRRGIVRFFLIIRYAICIIDDDDLKFKSEMTQMSTEIRLLVMRIAVLSTNLPTIAKREGPLTSTSTPSSSEPQRRTYSHVIEEDFIGLEDDVNELVRHLVYEGKGHNSYQTFCIWGMGGLGKTTLGQKVYKHSDVRRYFDCFAWASVSQQFQKQDVLEGILFQLIPEKKIVRRNELHKLLHEVQKNKKCLIVLDDIWEKEDWDIFKSAFFIGDMSSSSKLLLTTRNEQIALDPNVFRHQPQLLTDSEAWELLQKKAFRGTHFFPPDFIYDKEELDDLGRKMVPACGGLPLAVVLLGGILVTKFTVSEWEWVHENINSYTNKTRRVLQLLALSYDDLPYKLKRCFVYLGSFPEDSHIELAKLYQLWIAENLVLSKDLREDDTMMDVAERYLNELEDRCMVQLGVEESFYDRFVYCSLHDMVREECLSRNKERNFYNVIDFRHENRTWKHSESSSSSNSKVRRLAIYLGEEDNGQLDEWVSNPHHLRSVLLFGNYILGDPTLQLIRESHWKELKVLGVLHLEGVTNLGELSEAIGNLINLRYLSLRNCRLPGKLPSSIGNLRLLQTLDLRGNGELVIPNVLWKIESLTHLFLDDFIETNGKMIRLHGLSNLETLENFNSRWCNVEELLELTNLRKLRACIGDPAKKADYDVVAALVNWLCNHSWLRHSSIEIYHDFKSEPNLLIGLLGCRHLTTLWLTGIIGGGKLPAARDFSPSLTTLGLVDSKLKEDPMLTPERMPNLRYLSLERNSFEGVAMVCYRGSFPQLKSLQLIELSNLEEWRVDEGAMPNLSVIRIIRCRRLKMVPDGLRFLNNLQEMNIHEMPEAFVRRLQVVDGEEGADHYKIQHVPFMSIVKSYSSLI